MHEITCLYLIANASYHVDQYWNHIQVLVKSNTMGCGFSALVFKEKSVIDPSALKFEQIYSMGIKL